MSKAPRLRTVDKSVPPYKLNDFPADFPYKIGEYLIHILATRHVPSMEGSEWELMFAKALGAEWKPSNVGLDDIVFENTAWGAKSVKFVKPSKVTGVRLISGRNDPHFSYGYVPKVGHDADKIGTDVLEIWNERVSGIYKKYKFLRTVVLIRSTDLTEALIYEFETIRYNPDLYYWELNKNKNLEGYEKATKKHKFTWQPGGCQFTIIEEVPPNSLLINVKKPELISTEFVLDKIKYDKSWVTIGTGPKFTEKKLGGRSKSK